jgi:translation initiation factor IF-3
MRLAEDVKEIGTVEQPPLQDGRNMTMLLGPTKNAGVTKEDDAQAEDTQRSEEEVQGDGVGAVAAAARDEESPVGEEVAEA